MTILEALQAIAEYSNESLLGKVLIDNNLDPVATYDPSYHKDAVNLAAADAYEVMATYPEFKQGNSYSKWDSKSLLQASRNIRRSLGLLKGAKIKGTPIW